MARAVTNQTFCPSTERSSHLRDRAENGRKPRRSLGVGKQSISSVPVSFALASQGNISCSVSPNEKCALAFPSRPSRLLAFLQISSRSERRGHRDGTLASAMRAAFWQPRGHAMRGQGEAGRSARARTQFCFWRTKTKTISLEKSWRLQPGMELRTCWRSASPKFSPRGPPVLPYSL